MNEPIAVRYDGKVFVPEQPLDLPVGSRLLLQVVSVSEAKFASLLELAADLPGAPDDMAAQHDHYLYGTPKR